VKIRELKRKAGSAVASSWPPSWGGAYGPNDEFPTGDQGTLVDVKRQDKECLILTIEYRGKLWSGSLLWDGPPSLDHLERLLKVHCGETIRSISDVDV